MQDVFKDGNSQFLNNPKALDDIGNTTFLKLPFYKRKNKVNVIYINPKIYEKIFRKKYDYEVAKKDIIDRFSVTLKNDNNNDDVLGYGYVDRQGDPTDIALNGNKGSGRAFYLYENCNLKGEKTPFATSPRDDYNNGKYSLDCAIQECLISNVLNNILGFDNFETLAIIDLNEEFLFPHTEGKLPCGLIIRYYENNELYRFSHRFINNKNFSKEELYAIAKKIGILEGNKFIKRFLHGAWSIGNLSIDGNMIDLDTSFFVKGRHPQWSFTDKYITNYFGFEQKGQLKVLETVLNSDLNVDNVSLDELELIVEDNRKKTIRKEFAFLIGYDEKIYNKYASYFDKIADEFSFLSQMIYDNYDNLNCLDENCQNTYLFDFSNFFRYYEITKQNGTWSKMKGLSLLLNKDAKSLEYLYNDDNYHHKIKQFFSSITVDSTDRYMEFINRTLQFIEQFSSINELIDNNESIDKNKKLIQAYVENEDKKYLMARKWMRAELIDLYKSKGDKFVNEIINSIKGFYSQKDYASEYLYCDLIIYKEGILFREINTRGYNRFCLRVFDKNISDNFVLNIEDKNYLLKLNQSGLYISNFLPNNLISKLDNCSLFSVNNDNLVFSEIGRDIEKIKKI